jgi:ATP-dependent exoDNAse (exonuclease V) alpha subunit
MESSDDWEMYEIVPDSTSFAVQFADELIDLWASEIVEQLENKKKQRHAEHDLADPQRQPQTMETHQIEADMIMEPYIDLIPDLLAETDKNKRFSLREELLVSRAFESATLQQQHTLVCRAVATVVDRPGFTLNVKQRAAVRHCMLRMYPDQAEVSDNLVMYLGGEAGTGKSAVIDSIMTCFRLLGREHCVRKGAYMGTAANNIDGITVHSMLSLGLCRDEGQKNKPAPKSEAAKQALQEEFRDVNFLIVDEISMVSCEFLGRMNARLQEISSRRELGHVLGGMHVLMCGDFHQIPPVRETALYTRNPRVSTLGKEKTLTMQGKTVWEGVKEAIFLTEQMRLRTDHGNEREKAWSDAVQNTRNFDIKETDKATFMKKDISLTKKAAPQDDWNDTTRQWQEQPTFLVYANELREKLNFHQALAFASATKRTLYLAPAAHYSECDGEKLPATMKQQRRLLKSVPDKNADHLSGCIPYVADMPVIITNNKTCSRVNSSVEVGVSNGTMGKLSKLVLADADMHLRPKRVKIKGWTVDVVQLSEPPKLVIFKPDVVKHRPLNGLSEAEYPIETRTVSLKGFNSRKTGVRWYRTQHPIWPAFAITIHKSQGKTLSKVVADLGGANRAKEFPQLAYVALSRVRSVNDICILRGCRYDKIKNPDPDLLDELQRLREIEEHIFGDFTQHH